MTPSAPTRAVARFAAIAAFLSLAVMLLMVVIAGAGTPGYSHVSQFISELGARGAPQEWGVRFAGFLPVGVLLLGFCGAAFVALPRSPAAIVGLLGLVIYAAGYLVAAAFPCDPGCRPAEPSPSQLIHNAGGFIGYMLAPMFLFALAHAARSWPGAASLVGIGYLAAAGALVGLFTLAPDSPTVGLSQRLLEASVLGWVAWCGRYLSRKKEAP